MSRVPQGVPWAPLVLAFSLCACASRDPDPVVDLSLIAARHEVDLAQLRASQRELAAADLPPRLEFGELGSVRLNEVRVGGYPGRVFLRVNYTYENSSDKAVEAVQVTVLVRDLQAEIEWGQEAELHLPYLLPMHPDSSYTSYIEVPLEHLYRDSAWEFDLRLRALRDGEWAEGVIPAESLSLP